MPKKLQELLREEFHDWCMKNPATNQIELAIKMAQSADFFISKFQEHLQRVSDSVEGMKGGLGKHWSPDENDAYNLALSEVISLLSLSTKEDAHEPKS